MRSAVTNQRQAIIKQQKQSIE